jgi:hypothetical protein
VLSLLQMHLCDILESARDHEARVGQVKALAEDAGKVQDFGHHHAVISAGQVVGYVIAQHFFQDTLSSRVPALLLRALVVY